MTDQRLRELLHDRVADVVTTDLASGAWQGAARTRRRRTVGALAGAVAAVVAVAGLAVVVDFGPESQRETPPVGEPPAAARADTEYNGAPVWWGPTVAQESELPQLEGAPLPETIDLSTADASVPTGVRAVGVFETGSNAYVLADDGTLYTLDIGHLERTADENGNVRSPLGGDSVSPDGRHAFFIQNSSLEVYDLSDGTWSTIDTPDWLAEGARWMGNDAIWVPDRLGSTDGGTSYPLDGSGGQPTQVDWVTVWPESVDESWGPVRTTSGSAAQQYFLYGPVEGGDVDNPEAVVVREGEEHAILAMPYGVESQGPTRFKGCCSVVGWLDEDTVLFFSLSTEARRILAWDVGTERVYRVTEFASRCATSFADLAG